MYKGFREYLRDTKFVSLLRRIDMTEKELEELKELLQELQKDENTIKDLEPKVEDQFFEDSALHHFDATRYADLVIKTTNVKNKLVDTVPALLDEIFRLRGVLEEIQYSIPPEGIDPDRIYELVAKTLGETSNGMYAE